MGNIFLDVIIFNGVFILINIYNSIPLFLKYLEVKLKPLEEKVYQENFKNYLSRRNFKKLISKSILNFYSNDSQITRLGNSFHSLYYIALIDPSYEVILIKDGVELYPLKENSWVGIIEYMKYLKIDKSEILTKKRKIETHAQITGFLDLNWDVDCIIRKSSNSNNQPDRQINKDYPGACWVYSFSILELEKLFDKDEGFFFRNILYSFWLLYTAKAVSNVDKQLVSVKHDKESPNLIKSIYIISNLDEEELKNNPLTDIGPIILVEKHFDEIGGLFPEELNPDTINK